MALPLDQRIAAGQAAKQKALEESRVALAKLSNPTSAQVGQLNNVIQQQKAPQIKPSALTSPTAVAEQTAAAQAMGKGSWITGPRKQQAALPTGKPEGSVITGAVPEPPKEPDNITDAVNLTYAEQADLQEKGSYLEYAETFKKIMGTDAPFKTRDEYIAWRKNQNQADLDYLDKQQDYSRQIEGAQFQIAREQATASSAATTAQMAQGRNGATGSSAPIYVKEFKDQMNRQMSMLELQKGAAEQERQKQLADLEVAKQTNDMGLVDAIQGRISSIESDLRQNDSQQLQIATLANEQALEAAKFEHTKTLDTSANYRANLGMFGDMVNNGTEMTTAQIAGMSKSLDIPMEVAAGYYEGAKMIRDTKGMGVAQQEIALKDLAYEFNEKVQGIRGAQAQAVSDFTKLAKSGRYSQEELQSFATAMNIPNSMNPQYQLQNRMDAANVAIKEFEVKYLGKPPPEGTRDRLEYDKLVLDNKTAQYDYNELTGAGGDYDVDGVIAAGVDSVPAVGAMTSNALGSGVITGYGSKAWDKGLDFVVSGGMGAEVRSPIEGKVIAVATGHKKGESNSFGNQVKIQTSTGEQIWLSHLEGAQVNIGDTVNAGQVIGTQGNTGTTYGKTGVHVDITMKDKDGKYYDAKQVASFLDNISSAQKVKPAGTQVDYTGFASTLPPEAQTTFSSLSDMDKSNVSQLLSGDALVTDLVKGRGAAAGKEAQALLEKARSVDPTFSKSEQDVRFNFKKSWASPTAQPFKSRTSINTALEHMAALKTASEKLPVGWSTDVNSVANYMAAHTGDPAVADFNYIMGVMATEIAGAYKGGTPAEGEIEHDREAIMANLSQQQMSTVLDSAAKLLGSKVSALGDGYKDVMGKYPDQPLVYDEALKQLEASGIDVAPLKETRERQSNGQVAAPTDNWGMFGKITDLFGSQASAAPVAGTYTLPD
jgi:murein DD-endopeptidase MepM/ murein hydrolase activator NlpD